MLKGQNLKKIIAASIFILLGIHLSTLVPSVEIAWVSSLLLLIIFLFAFEVVRVDVAAMSLMVLLGLSTLLAPLIGLQQGLVAPEKLFQGFSSNAVISIIGVMIIGSGLDRTGMMSRVARFILRIGGKTEKSLIPVISFTVGMISSFMQNVGVSSLFMPVVSRVSARSGVARSRLLMPMGFMAILGGTITMIGSSPLILLNDLILNSNQALPDEHQMQLWGLFSVTPIGIALLIAGIIFFVIWGRFLLPIPKDDLNTTGIDALEYFNEVYGVKQQVQELQISKDSHLIGVKLVDFEIKYRVRVIATKLAGGTNKFGPGALARDTVIRADMVLGVIAEAIDLDQFVKLFGLEKGAALITFADELSSVKSGIAEVVVHPASSLIGQSPRQVRLHNKYGLAVIALHRNGITLRESDDIRNMLLQAGDTLVVHTSWKALYNIEGNRDFIVVTTEYPHEGEQRPHKVIPALFFFVLALSLVLFTDTRLSVALITGAVGMILSGVLKIDEAYEAVSWKTIFLLASLIPLGMAVENSGTAKWIAEQMMLVVGNMPIWVIQSSIAILATFFTLVMSNVGATVLLVPLAINMAIATGANPAVFALTVAIATSNSFIMPTHQVNALIMGPGGYHVRDYMKVGGIMTILFLVVMISMLNIIF